MTAPVSRSEGREADFVECHATVHQGRLRGAESDGIRSYRAVPYAAPPLGLLRFLPPALPEHWSGIRAADLPENFAAPRVHANITESYNGPEPRADDEDCLYLNVTAPANTDESLPVLVFFHGGAFRSGSAFQADFDAERLARAGVVVVAVNYRLGILGYLELGEHLPELSGSGNNGLRDQIAALEWVQENIGTFGGDPTNVTAIGQSAGAISISALLAGAPQRLMRRAILQSGSGYLVRSRAEALKTTAAVLSSRGLKRASDLLDMPIADLVELQRKLLGSRPSSAGFLFGPYVDGHMVPGPVNVQLAAGSAHGVDTLMGTTADEATFFALTRPVMGLAPAAANPFFPPELKSRRRQIIAAYSQGSTPRNRFSAPLSSRPLMRMLTDQLFRVPATRMADAHHGHGNVFMYRFDWQKGDAPRQRSKAVGALHCIELPFLFGGLRTDWIPGPPAETPESIAAQRRLSDRMIAAWTNFARTGDPSAGSGPRAVAWPQYTPSDRATLLWNECVEVVTNPNEDQRAAWGEFGFDHLRYERRRG